MVKYNIHIPVEINVEVDINEVEWYVPINRALALGQEITKNLLQSVPYEIVHPGITAKIIKDKPVKVEKTVIPSSGI